jgi:hypothetical protein
MQLGTISTKPLAVNIPAVKVVAQGYASDWYFITINIIVATLPDCFHFQRFRQGGVTELELYICIICLLYR